MRICERCLSRHDGIIGSGRFCSRSCANARTWSSADKLKKSKANKGNPKVAAAGRKSWQKTETKCKRPITTTCAHCGCDMVQHTRYLCKYHPACWKKIRGGPRAGSGRGKSGWYDGIYCDSSWELAYVLWCRDHDKLIVRNKQGYPYEHNEYRRMYYPDFVVDGVLVEIKGYKTKQWLAKLAAMTEPIEVLYSKEMQPIIEYVVERYGNDYTLLYNNNGRVV